MPEGDTECSPCYRSGYADTCREIDIRCKSKWFVDSPVKAPIGGVGCGDCRATRRLS